MLTTPALQPGLGRESEAGSVKIIVPKKVAKLAVRRNRLKRLIKEALRLHFHPKKDKNYVFRVVKDPGDIGIDETKKAVHAVWGTA